MSLYMSSINSPFIGEKLSQAYPLSLPTTMVRIKAWIAMPHRLRESSTLISLISFLIVATNYSLKYVNQVHLPWRDSWFSHSTIQVCKQAFNCVQPRWVLSWEQYIDFHLSSCVEYILVVIDRSIVHEEYDGSLIVFRIVPGWLPHEHPFRWYAILANYRLMISSNQFNSWLLFIDWSWGREGFVVRIIFIELSMELQLLISLTRRL